MNTEHDVTQVSEKLAVLDELPVTDHVSVYEELHNVVAGALATIDSDTK